MTAMLMISDKRSITFVASNRARRCGSPVTANSVTGLGNPISKRRNSAPITIAGAFFMPAVRVMAAVRGRHSCLPGSFCPGLPTCAQLPPIRLVTNVAAPPGSAKRVPADRVYDYQSDVPGGATLAASRDNGFWASGGCLATVLIDGKKVARIDTGEIVNSRSSQVGISLASPAMTKATAPVQCRLVSP